MNTEPPPPYKETKGAELLGTPRWKVATKWRGVPPGVGTNSAARQNSSTIHTPLGVSISPPKLRED